MDVVRKVDSQDVRYFQKVKNAIQKISQEGNKILTGFNLS